MIFKTPLILFSIPIVLTGVLWYRRRQTQPGLRLSSLELVSQITPSWRLRLAWFPFGLRLLAIAFFLVALAGPRKVLEETIVHTEGVDIILALDASGTMAAEDFIMNGNRVNRLEVVKNVVKEFINGRRYDRIGLVVFSGVAYTISPLTTDHGWLVANLERVRLGLIKDGTAIGSAITMSLSRLTKSKAKTKIVILLTDGMNNAGQVEPSTAAKAAVALGIKIYTIGAGTKGFVPFPLLDVWGRKIYQKVQIDMDEELLQTIANTTHAKYFRATDTESLRQIYQEIDKLEKTKIDERGYKEYKEFFGYWLVAGLVVLALELLLFQTLFYKLP